MCGKPYSTFPILRKSLGCIRVVHVGRGGIGKSKSSTCLTLRSTAKTAPFVGNRRRDDKVLTSQVFSYPNSNVRQKQRDRDCRCRHASLRVLYMFRTHHLRTHIAVLQRVLVCAAIISPNFAISLFLLQSIGRSGNDASKQHAVESFGKRCTGAELHGFS